jgi:hypothetical protein
MSDPSVPSPDLVYSIDLGEGDDAYRVVASYWRPPAAPEDTWRLEAFDRISEGGETFFTQDPDLTMNIPASSLDLAVGELDQQAVRHENQAQPYLDAAALIRDQEDMVKALVEYLAQVGRPAPSTPAVPAEEPSRRKPKGPKVRDPAAAVSHPGIPADQAAQMAAAGIPATTPAAEVVAEPAPSTPGSKGSATKKAARRG